MADNENGQSNGLVDPETGDRVSIEDMEPEVLGARLQGTDEQLSFDLGSEYQLSDSTLKLTSVPSMGVTGQYSEGDRIKVILEVEIEYISFPPVKDRGFRVGTERRHYGQVLSAAPAVDE
jgi:hypothetical protein